MGATTDVRIRPFDEARDLETCARMMSGSEPWITLGRDYEASRRALADPTREKYVAEDGRGLAGFLILNMNGPFAGYIQSVCVAPDRRRRGIGSHLVRFAEERSFRDWPNVFLCVSSFNTGAKRLYERLGYRVVGELSDYVVSGHSEILMRKTIGPTRGYRRRDEATS